MAFYSDRRKGDLVYLFDMNRGIEVLRMKKGAHHSKYMKSVTAPSVKKDALAAQPVRVAHRQRHELRLPAVHLM